jgi:hypothetical protein
MLEREPEPALIGRPLAGGFAGDTYRQRQLKRIVQILLHSRMPCSTGVPMHRVGARSLMPAAWRIAPLSALTREATQGDGEWLR